MEGNRDCFETIIVVYLSKETLVFFLEERGGASSCKMTCVCVTCVSMGIRKLNEKEVPNDGRLTMKEG